MKKRILITVAVAMIVTAGYAQAGRSAIDGQWHGWWTSFSAVSQGYLYEGTMTLTSGPGNSVEGRIEWALRKSPRSEEQAKIGMAGTEYVRGDFNPETKVLRLSGYRKDDPNNILGLDNYQLILSPNGNVIGGITSSNDTWQGVFSTTRGK